jgi:hypothetical protein
MGPTGGQPYGRGGQAGPGPEQTFGGTGADQAYGEAQPPPLSDQIFGTPAPAARPLDPSLFAQRAPDRPRDGAPLDRPPLGAPAGPRAAAQQAGPRSRRGRPEDPRQAAVYDALAINEQVLDEVWTSPSVDVLKVVSSIVVNALDAYEDDPAEYADWVAVHRTGNCDCH